jgi:hypothetical protein
MLVGIHHRLLNPGVRQADMVKIQLVDEALGKDGARIVPALRDHGLPELVSAGEIIDVPPALAGAGPSWRKPREEDDLVFMETKVDDEGTVTSVHDLGHGLLAQLGVWAKPAAEPAKDEPQPKQGQNDEKAGA